MITNLENTAVQLSATKKDFYQIWNEILELAGKISERWDPTSTNESDPGIVLLKVLTAVADKLNYTIDANTLEAFMPSAAQEESMRKLTEMLGYTMKYYQSATTDVKISYTSAGHEAIDTNVVIDRFTNIKDRDDSINYVTLNRIELNNDNTTKIVQCMEGELVECETDDDNIISLLQLDDNNRYYLPETQIAENGIFISNISDNNESDDWAKVDNLNTQNIKTKCYKFGFDSREDLPYIQFPDDIANIIEDGLKIKYIRTNGINGNISVNTLVKMESPKSWGDISSNAETNEQNTKDYYNPDNYSVTNIAAANNGSDKESLNDAYNSYKKTIGTFDTLVTCRDYMNRIYQMTFSDVDTTNLVSNIIVSDIRDDINKAFTLCTFNQHGIAYEHMARELNTLDATEISQTAFEGLTDEQKQAYFESNTLFAVTDGEGGPVLFYAKCICIKSGINETYDTIKVDATPISHFDLVFYPFKNIYGLNTKTEYVRSFQYDNSNLTEIKQGIEANKTMSHNIIAPEEDDLACIKNYLKLNAKITTTKKVNSIEQASILGNIYSSLYANFNMRKVDFGEEIPYDSILAVIENADPRIKNVSLEEPTLITKYCTVDGNEYLTSANYSEESDLGIAGDRYYNKLALNNVLAGRISLFNYNENFKPEYTEYQYPNEPSPGTGSYDLVYPNETTTTKIWALKPSFNITSGGKDIELNDNEVIQFRLPNLKTKLTYPAYVNYYIHLEQINDEDVPIIPATMLTLNDFIIKNQIQANAGDTVQKVAYTNLIDSSRAVGGIGTSILKIVTDEIIDQTTFENALDKYKVLYYKHNDTYSYTVEFIEEADGYYYIAIDDDTVGIWHNWLTGIRPNTTDRPDNNNYDVWTELDGFYYIKTTDLTRSIGYLVDTRHNKYQLLSAVRPGTSVGNIFTTYYIQKTSNEDKSDGNIEGRYTKNGLGQNGSYAGINANTEYQLRDDEYLLVNYTSSTTQDSEEVKTVINECYTKGTVIKPNFKLIDSLKYRETHSYSKTTGYDFSEFTEIPQPAGMFTLGVNEQIEIRDFAKVKLDEVSSNIYWELQNERPDDENGRILFNWDEDPITISGKIMYLSHTLKEGEYFYYTNKDKTDIAYYGSGTKITRTINTPKIYKHIKDSSISTEDIASTGLSAAIPWRAYNFSDADGIDRHIELLEYKYVNLVKGDKLKTVGDEHNTGNPDDIEVNISTNSWTKISSATYESGGVQKPLPKVDLEDSNFCWEVTSRLELNVSPTETQTLHTGEHTEDILALVDENDHNIVELKAWGAAYPLSIKTNKLLQGSYKELDVTTKKYTDDGQIEEIIPDLEVKVFKVKPVQDANEETVNLNNFGEGNFTKLNFADCLDPSLSYVDLNTIVPAGSFGLIMFYSIGGTSGNAGIKLSSDAAPTIYNNNDSWWNSPDTLGVYRFRTGLNIVKIPESCQIELFSDALCEDIIVFGDLDIINSTAPINPKLCYKKIEEATAEAQILADINALDKNHNFYYNNILSNSSSIDLNESDEEDTLENPLSWYNYNNINNKFVISEIDAGALSNGIVIAKSSKL